MGKVYYPGEEPNRGFVPHLGGIIPGTPVPTIVGNPHLRGGPFVALPGYGIEGAEASTNMLDDPHFPDLTNWTQTGSPATAEVGPQFAMDQGEHFGGLHIVANAGAGEGVFQTDTLVGSTDYTASAWFYVVSGGARMRVNKGDGTYETNNTTKIGQWERVVYSWNSLGTSGRVDLATTGASSEFYAWMPQLEQDDHVTPARIGAQVGSGIYCANPVASSTQVPWSVVCVVTPDWDGDAGSDFPNAWSMYDDADNRIALTYSVSSEYWLMTNRASASSDNINSSVTHSRGEHLHFVTTCDGYNLKLYINGSYIGTKVMKDVAATNLTIGNLTSAMSNTNSLNGVVDDFLFTHGCIPEVKVRELYQKFKRGIPLHGLIEGLDLI